MVLDHLVCDGEAGKNNRHVRYLKRGYKDFFDDLQQLDRLMSRLRSADPYQAFDLSHVIDRCLMMYTEELRDFESSPGSEIVLRIVLEGVRAEFRSLIEGSAYMKYLSLKNGLESFESHDFSDPLYRRKIFGLLRNIFSDLLSSLGDSEHQKILELDRRMRSYQL